MKDISKTSSGENCGGSRHSFRFCDATMMWLWLAAAFVIMIGVGGTRILLEHWNLLPGFIKSGLTQSS
jgi:hypothetical protein